MASKNKLLLKLKDIRYMYGSAAADYFVKHPFCHTCGEKRLVCLAVHHLDGKHDNDSVEILCHNCHAVYHANNSQSTYESEIKKLNDKTSLKEELKIRNNKILELKNLNYSTAEISMIFKLDPATVRSILRSFK